MRKLAILGKGETLKFFPGPWRETGKQVGFVMDEDFDEVWGLNQLKLEGLDLDRLYVMDDLVYRMPFYAGTEFVNGLKSYEGRLITSKQYDDWPTSEAYPIEEVCKFYGLPLGCAMYSTTDYMIAQAVIDQWDEIHLFGVDNLTKGLEEMRAATALWIGVAQARGIKVVTPPGSFYQFFTNVGVAMEFGMYGYAFRPRIENLVESV